MSDLWKPTQPGSLIYTLALLLIILGTTPAGHARDVNPPEVQALIGMRIPAKAPGRYGSVPGWNASGGGIMQETNGVSLSFTHLTNNRLVVLAISKNIESDWSRVILDAKALPLGMLSYRLLRGKPVPKKNAHLYFSLYGWCKRDAEDSLILALARPEPDKENCEHDTQQIGLAWEINPQTGKIESTPTEGVSCTHVAGDSCVHF
jgi:hypothetical protein